LIDRLVKELKIMVQAKIIYGILVMTVVVAFMMGAKDSSCGRDQQTIKMLNEDAAEYRAPERVDDPGTRTSTTRTASTSTVQK
jgi:hypothetical protein